MKSLGAVGTNVILGTGEQELLGMRLKQQGYILSRRTHLRRHQWAGRRKGSVRVHGRNLLGVSFERNGARHAVARTWTHRQ